MGFPSRTEAKKFYFELRFSKYPKGYYAFRKSATPGFFEVNDLEIPSFWPLPAQIEVPFRINLHEIIVHKVVNEVD